MKKNFIKTFCLIFFALILFFSGFVLGHLETNRRWEDTGVALKVLANYFYQKIDENFGNINEENRKELNIIGGFGFYKDMGFGIILENNVKTMNYPAACAKLDPYLSPCS
jgi:hypothetical protein